MDYTEELKAAEEFGEIAEEYKKLPRDERQQVKGIIVGMNIAKTLRGAAGQQAKASGM